MTEHIITTTLCLLFAALFVAAALYFARRGLSANAKSILLGLVAEAEAYFGSGTGRIKFSAVLSRLYAAMPRVMQLLFRPSTIEGWIEEAVAAMKDYLSEGNDEAT